MSHRIEGRPVVSSSRRFGVDLLTRVAIMNSRRPPFLIGAGDRWGSIPFSREDMNELQSKRLRRVDRERARALRQALENALKLPEDPSMLSNPTSDE